MIKLSNSSLMKILFKLLILLLIAKSITLGLWWYLPSDGVDVKVKNNYQPKYQRVYFSNMIVNKSIKKETPTQEIEETISTNEFSGINITNMLLKGLYGTSSKAFVIVAMKATPKKTEILSIDDVFKGYRLKSITSKSAVFEKNSKNYILTLDKSIRANDPKIMSQPVKTTSKDKLGVSRKDIAYFAKNPKQIWRDISIKEIKDGKKILGFKVTKIKRRSKFADLGLKKGDLIIKANNVKLESYKDALALYKNIDKLDAIQIVVMRDNQEVELVYDLN